MVTCVIVCLILATLGTDEARAINRESSFDAINPESQPMARKSTQDLKNAAASPASVPVPGVEFVSKSSNTVKKKSDKATATLPSRFNLRRNCMRLKAFAKVAYDKLVGADDGGADG